ncbi:hypothetical protein NPX13_g4 [Xylaria arbuscula]|uniref:Uncharacterized protein n=1 Tax=Xylaria arbuscula TaxID=114810 RepID=A0A9W8NNN6_9PEZI|nr:hypothetical protein NPX13_g4 [Xylaria arbuscula]
MTIDRPPTPSSPGLTNTVSRRLSHDALYGEGFYKYRRPVWRQTERASRENRGRRNPRPREVTEETSAGSIRNRDMHVIDAFFSRPGAPPPTEVAWTDFIRAMTHIGFSMSPGNQGNYRFSVATRREIFPPGSRGQVITAHRPHGRTTLSLVEMREIGRRLNRAFGWSANTFKDMW